jgi:DNA-binding MarR family transcriptional regulator
LADGLYYSVVNDSVAARPVAFPLAYRLVGAGHRVEQALDEALAPLGLSLPKFGLISKLAEAGEPIPLGELAERCSCVRSNITQLVDRLEADGLVQRTDDPKDRRSILATLTTKGRALQSEAEELLEQAQRSAVEALSAAEQTALERLLGRLAPRK